ncbi:hypothetical protein AXA44_27610 [Rhodococcus sp. SC4]|nr:hypothetical protein AXA44_27610 [Rhodococcus sp. SC4]
MDSQAVESAVRHVAMALAPRQTEIGDRLWDHIVSARPDLMRTGDTALTLAKAACHSTNATLVNALSGNTPVEELLLTTEIIRATRALAVSGFSEDDVTAGYRLGITCWCENWANAVEEYCPDPVLSVKVASYGTSFALGWLETVRDQVLSEYRDEAERLPRDGSIARAAYVRNVLTDENLDIAVAGKDLRYNLAGDHVALVLTRHPGSNADTPLDSIARAVASKSTPSAPLTARFDLDTVVCWIPTDDARAVSAPHAPVSIGQGRPAHGLEGFRRSHREAGEAARVARLARRPAGTVTRFVDVELVALCSTDATACRAFVEEQLGPLVEDTEMARRLRDTLETFLASNQNFRATAARLGVHHNTVRYRLEQTSALLGGMPEERDIHLWLALHLAKGLGMIASATD